MSDDNLAPCPHGIPHEQRKRDGCEDCDQASFDAFRSNQEAAKFRARVIQTARLLVPEFIRRDRADRAYIDLDLFTVAEFFEKSADEYLNGDKP